MMYTEFAPYLGASVNAVAVAAQWQLVFSFLAGIVITEDLDFDGVALGILLLLTNIVIIALACWFQFAVGSSNVHAELVMMEMELRETELLNAVREIQGDMMSKQYSSQCEDLSTTPTTSHVRMPTRRKTTIQFVFGVHDSREILFDKGAYPCFVVALANLQLIDRLPIHEEAISQGILDELSPESRDPSSAFSFFISQNWECHKQDAPHPDNVLNTKLLWIKNLHVHLNIPRTCELWVWWDLISCPQIDPRLQGRAIQSLCYCKSPLDRPDANLAYSENNVLDFLLLQIRSYARGSSR